ncbi:MAG: IgGFc-binding protein [Deltaproteobacteria bacterium]|nr:IgGFc-binding protein [Deltaproteobacteria bacterium]
MRSFPLLSALAIVPAMLATSPGCSAGGNDSVFDPATHKGGSGGSSGNQGGGGSGNTGGTIITTEDSGPPCELRCSADLHQVIDCHDVVTVTCPATQGCGQGGKCTDPCSAAQANKSTLGCDFYSLPPSPETETPGSCFAALIANTWTSPISITVEYQGQQLDVGNLARVPVGSGTSITYQPLQNGQLGVGEVGILFLSQGPPNGMLHVGCPAGTASGINSDPALLGTGFVNAFHITTSAPIVAYDIYPYGGAPSYVSSATQLIPTPAWGTNYIAADAYEVDPNLVSFGGMPFVQIVAAQDDTTVTISPTSAIVGGGGVNPTGAGQPQDYKLNRGQAVQFLQNAELAGSPISSDKPISVWGGTGCMYVPLGVYACDSGHQELLPVSAMGFAYAAVRHRGRSGQEENAPWTLIGAVDDTQLVYEPSAPPGAPDTVGSGQMVRFNASEPFIVKSQDDKHPFYLSAVMTGGDNGHSGMGDPEWVNSVPPAQYLAHYLFLTDPTYGNTNLVFVRQKAKDGTFKDVTLDCVGVLGDWQPVGNEGQYEYTRVDLNVGGQPQGACDNGVHIADSEAAFGLTVWGWDSYVSYAYTAGMSTQPINTVVVPPVPK